MVSRFDGGCVVGLKKLAAVAAVLVLAGCETLPAGRGFGAERANFAAGSTLGADLQRRDIEALSTTFLSAIETGQTGVQKPWRGSEARGVVTPGEYRIANLRSNPKMLLAAPAGLDIRHVVETELGTYVLTRNSNIRLGPGTDAAIAEILPSGTGVDGVGRVIDRPWMLIASKGTVHGYVSQKLLVKAPGAELTLAGGPRRKPYLCRAFTQRLQVFGRSDEWRGVACNRGDGWRLEIDDNAPARLF